jgi:NAD(P)-dependent dehydrogenase (short-subunit alcohol dehydrogenase family)
MRFKDNVAIVTGRAFGQDLETCKRLAAEGALVIVADWNGEGAKRATLLVVL